MRITKKLALIMLSVLSALCLAFGAVACGEDPAKEAIQMYILPQNETLVDADFTLPKKIGKDDSVAVEWKSDNTAAIAIEDGGADKYKAVVTLQDEVTSVKLTISSGKESKDFTVRVDELSVYTFMDNYTFAQRKTSVKEDFALDMSTTFQGKTASISWKIDADKYGEYISLNAEGNGVVVTPGDDLVDVEIEATFSYGSETATQKYPFSVVPLLEHRQLVNRYYSVTDYPLELSGYIVHVVEASESYGNATFYMIDDDFCSGYYCYRVKIDTSKIDRFVEGAHVTVSGDTTKNYNGLWENNSGGTAVVDDETPINPREKVYAMDTDLLSGVPSLIWHESTFVSLSGWKVASKAESKPTAADTNLFTLQRGDTKITVRITKYMQRTDAELAALCNVYDDVNVGDFVDVTGILGNYNGFQIQPVVASDIKKVSAEGTDENAAKVKAAVDAVSKAVSENFASIVTTDKTVTMPDSVEGVSISYEVTGAKDPTVTIDGGKFTINPVSSEMNYDIQVTYQIGDYEGYGFFKLRNQRASAQEIISRVKATVEALTFDEIAAAGEVALPEVDTLGAELDWSVKDAPEWILIDDGKIIVSALPATATQVTLIATISFGGESETVTFTLNVSAAPAQEFKAIEAPAAGTYKFAMLNANTNTTYYATGAMDGNYFATSADIAEAADFVITQNGDKNEYTITVNGKYLEFVPRTDGKTGVNIALNDKQTEGKYWQWVDAIQNFVFETVYNKDNNPDATDTDLYYLGTYGNFTTMSGNYIGRIATKGEDGSYTANGSEGVSQWVAHFGKMVDVSNDPFEAIEAPAAGDYLFALYQGNLKKWLYSTGEINSSNFGVTTEDPAEAATFTLTAKDGGWTIQLKSDGKFLELNDSHRMCYVDASTQTWKWNETYQVFTFDVTESGSPVTYYIGSYNTFDTFSASKISYLEGGTNFAAKFGKAVESGESTENGIKLTYTALPFGGGYNAEEMTGELGGVTFGWIGVMANTYDGETQNSIQGRQDKGSVIYTKTALPKSVKEIKFTMKGSSKYANNDVFIVSFATSFEGLATAPETAQVHMNTEKDVTEYTVPAPEGEWTFLRLTWGDPHASNWDTIEIVFND